jgi:hypothetical protein
MKRYIGALLIVISCAAFNLNAQITDAEESLRDQSSDTTMGWKTGGVFGVNFNQVSLSNWAAGGQNSVSLNGILNLFANYKKGNASWDNSLLLNYGESKLGGSDWIKSDDRILFNSKYGRKASEHWYYAALVDFKSQFAPGYTTAAEIDKISDFLAPGYVLGAAGMDYKPNDKLSAFISPITSKLTIVNDQRLADQGAFGVEAAEYAGDDPDSTKLTDGKNTRLELGGYFRLVYKTELFENVSFQTNLDLFSNYTENPQNIDVNWDNLLSLKVNDFLTTTITTSLIYDDDINITETDQDGNPKLDVNGNPIIGPRTQFKYVISVGIQYKFGDKQ